MIAWLAAVLLAFAPAATPGGRGRRRLPDAADRSRRHARSQGRRHVPLHARLRRRVRGGRGALDRLARAPSISPATRWRSSSWARSSAPTPLSRMSNWRSTTARWSCGATTRSSLSTGTSHDPGGSGPRLERGGRGRAGRDRGAAARDPCRAGARARLPAHDREIEGLARRPAAGDPRQQGDQRLRRPARRRQARPHRAAARRHGRAADPRGDRPRLRIGQGRARCMPAATTPIRRCWPARRASCAAAATTLRAPSSSCSSRARRVSTARGT